MPWLESCETKLAFAVAAIAHAAFAAHSRRVHSCIAAQVTVPVIRGRHFGQNRDRTFAAVRSDKQVADRGVFGFSIFADAAFVIRPVNESGFQCEPIKTLPADLVSFRTLYSQLCAAG